MRGHFLKIILTVNYNVRSIGYQLHTVPEQGTYLSSTLELSAAIDEWLSRTPGITIISINTFSSPITTNGGYAASITFSNNIAPLDKQDAVAC